MSPSVVVICQPRLLDRGWKTDFQDGPFIRLLSEASDPYLFESLHHVEQDRSHDTSHKAVLFNVNARGSDEDDWGPHREAQKPCRGPLQPATILPSLSYSYSPQEEHLISETLRTVIYKQWVEGGGEYEGEK